MLRQGRDRHEIHSISTASQQCGPNISIRCFRVLACCCSRLGGLTSGVQRCCFDVHSCCKRVSYVFHRHQILGFICYITVTLRVNKSTHHSFGPRFHQRISRFCSLSLSETPARCGARNAWRELHASFQRLTVVSQASRQLEYGWTAVHLDVLHGMPHMPMHTSTASGSRLQDICPC